MRHITEFFNLILYSRKTEGKNQWLEAWKRNFKNENWRTGETNMMERRFRVWRKGKLEEVGKPDRKMQSSTMAKLGGGTRTASLSSPFSTSTINPIVVVPGLNAMSESLPKIWKIGFLLNVCYIENGEETMAKL